MSQLGACMPCQNLSTASMENESTKMPTSAPVPTFSRRGTFFAMKKSGTKMSVSMPQ